MNRKINNNNKTFFKSNKYGLYNHISLDCTVQFTTNGFFTHKKTIDVQYTTGVRQVFVIFHKSHHHHQFNGERMCVGEKKQRKKRLSFTFQTISITP